VLNHVHRERLTGSEFSKAGILKAYPRLHPGRVVVAPCAAAPDFRPISRSAAAAAVRSKYEITAPFILTVGDLLPRKNQIGLIQAFARLVKGFPQFNHELVLVGKGTWFAHKVSETARHSGVADRIRFLGYVPDEDLLQLYNACEVFAFPSLYEGFGLPVLEAMACGRAVVCSSASSLPEVADSAALLVDPRSADDMARAMADLLLDSELRTRMERLGAARAAQFSWQKTAQITLDTFYRVAEGRRVTAPLVAPSIAQR
jgi:glycosyltransferase involved in cell wall biosynthesis